MKTAIIIVSFRTPDDIADCLQAIDRLETCGEFTIHIVENGGSSAFRALVLAAGSVCQSAAKEFPTTGVESRVGSRHLRCVESRLPRSGALVFLAEAKGNLGYAGGVNSWLEHAATIRDCDGFWILNPDTSPEPNALSALIAACRSSRGGMAGSVILDYHDRRRIVSRGLCWQPWRATVIGVDHGRSLSSDLARRRIDAPSGTSLYVTRSCLDKIGFMNEDYFLYFEDLDWGLRAKAAGQLCTADGSLVPHKYGSSLGSASKRTQRSTLSVYLDTRNLLLFTRRHAPAYIPLAVLRSLVRVVEYLAVGSKRNSVSALRGLVAGIRGHSGQPSWYDRSAEAPR